MGTIKKVRGKTTKAGVTLMAIFITGLATAPALAQSQDDIAADGARPWSESVDGGPYQSSTPDQNPAAPVRLNLLMAAPGMTAPAVTAQVTPVTTTPTPARLPVCACQRVFGLSTAISCVIKPTSPVLFTTLDAMPAGCTIGDPPPPPPPVCTADSSVQTATWNIALPPTGSAPSWAPKLTSWVDPMFSGMLKRLPIFAGAEVKTETKGQLSASDELQTKCCSGPPAFPSNKETLKTSAGIGTKVTATSQIGFHTLLSILPSTQVVEMSPAAPGARIDSFVRWAGVTLELVGDLGNDVSFNLKYRLQQAACDEACKFRLFNTIGGVDTFNVTDAASGSIGLQAKVKGWLDVRAGGQLKATASASIGFDCKQGAKGSVQASAGGCLYAKVKALGWEYKNCGKDWLKGSHDFL